jgi:23S rRNA pseudouridine2605 synthase
MRINQYIASGTGISRRAGDEEVAHGRVRINGKVAQLGDQVAPTDTVTWKGKSVTLPVGPKTTIMLNKPVGYVSSRKRDETGAPTVMELLPKELAHLRPVGRLDKESCGLLLLSDDGDLLYRSTHPKFMVEKEYVVEFEERFSPDELARWKKGMRFPDGVARADVMEHQSGRTYRIVLHQGMTRQIRRMAGKSGNAVVNLLRTKAGKYSLGKLKTGKWEKLG